MQPDSFSTETDLRYRPIQNKNQAHETNEKEMYPQPDRPYHIPRDSLFSSTSGYSNFRALFNIIIVLLIVSAISYVYDNGMRLVCLTYVFQKLQMVILNPLESPTPLIMLGLNIFIIISFLIEKCFAKGMITENVGRVLIISYLLALIIVPAVLVVYIDSNPVVATIVLGHVTIVFLKLVSYHMVNYWCRRQQNYLSAAKKESFAKGMQSQMQQNRSKSLFVTYPNNVCLKDLYYFIFIPTLSYHLNFPRSNRIRKKFVLARILELVLLPEMILVIYKQWIVPTFGDSMHVLMEKDAAYITKTLLKLAVPHHFVLTTAFYLLFHTYFNLSAEIMMFADREFYKDWWDAESFQSFWNRWNIPVHRWCSRHLYKPLLLSGFSNHFANITVFLVSAFFHEYCISVPTKCIKIWIFLFLLSQAPLIVIVDWHQLNKFGNITIWIFIISEQQIYAICFYQDYIRFL